MQEIEAFEKRALDAGLASDMGASFRNGIFSFEYRSGGEPSFTKKRSIDKKFWIEPAGSQLHLWNIDSIRGLGSKPEHPLVITEGEFDSIAVKQACDNLFVVSVPNGANGQKSEGTIYPDQDQGFRYLWTPGNKLLQELDQFSKIILATDGDEKGALLRDELAIRLGEGRCWFVEYPKGCKDANDLLITDRENGEARLRSIIAAAKPMRPGYLVKPSELPSREGSEVYSTGWQELDRHIQLVRPELVVVTGIPNHGKGQWIRSLSFRLAKAHHWRTAFFTPEDPHERLKRDMARFARSHYPEDIDKKDAIKNWMDEHFRISNPPDDNRITMQLVMNEMDAAALQEDCQMFVLDPWNEISHDRKNRLDTEYIEEALVDLKRKARRLKMVLVIVAHPRKIEEEKKPDLYSISGSANWKNKCDHGIIVHRMNMNNTISEITVEKCKDFETMGVPGKVHMTFNKGTADFSPTEKE